MNTDYISVTEISGDEVTHEQIERLCSRYYWAANYCTGKDVVEAACGTGQGLGYLSKISNTFEGGDFSAEILKIARNYYGEKIILKQFDAQEMPYEDKSKDIILLFEAIYYLPDAEKFVKECARILRPGGKVLIATANKDLYDFNPSPYSYTYYGVIELKELFHKFGFITQFWGNTPLEVLSIKQRILRPMKKIVIFLGLMPQSMAGKKLLKRLVFGNLLEMPAEVDEHTAKIISPDLLPSDEPCVTHKVIFCEATLDSQRSGH